MNYNIIQIKSAKEILTYLIRYNYSFIESIESRVGELKIYSQKLFLHGNIYVAEKDGETLGIIIFYSNDKITKTAYITMIVVEDDCKGIGIGSTLLQKCEQVVKEVGMKKLKLEVDKDNIDAIKFYKTRGFMFLDKASERTLYLQKELDKC